MRLPSGPRGASVLWAQWVSQQIQLSMLVSIRLSVQCPDPGTRYESQLSSLLVL